MLDKIIQKIAALIAKLNQTTGETDTTITDAVDSLIDRYNSMDNTSDATATADDILSSKTAYAKGQKLTGTIAVNSETINITPQKAGAVIAGKTYYENNINIAGDNSLIAANIVSGATIFGVAGTALGSHVASCNISTEKGNKLTFSVTGRPKMLFIIRSSTDFPAAMSKSIGIVTAICFTGSKAVGVATGTTGLISIAPTISRTNSDVTVTIETVKSFVNGNYSMYYTY